MHSPRDNWILESPIARAKAGPELLDDFGSIEEHTIRILRQSYSRIVIESCVFCSSRLSTRILSVGALVGEAAE